VFILNFFLFYFSYIFTCGYTAYYCRKMISAVNFATTQIHRPPHCILIFSLNNTITHHITTDQYTIHQTIRVFITASPYNYVNCHKPSYEVTHRLLNFHMEFPFLSF